ncbi:hypothetical protein ACFXI0_16245 [Kitasatospora indigofera]|uniref:hypothetical protein n=1 Tax=Kitasatospora indigofera TaxID=67307 RepID=UPI00369BD3E7
MRPRLTLRFRRERRPDAGPPEEMNYIEESYVMATERERFAREARAAFDLKVAAASGSTGWENFSLLVLAAASFAVVLTRGLRHPGPWTYLFAGAGVLCLGLLLLRWWLQRRAGRPRPPAER